MRCEEVLRKMDLLLDGELNDAERFALEAHLGECAECREEVERRARLRERLRQAVKQPVETAALEKRVRGMVRNTTPGSGRWRGTMAAAAAVCVALAGMWAYQNGYSSDGGQTEYLASLSGQVNAVMRVGLVDHVHCSVFRRWPKPSPPIGDVVKDLEPKYRPVAALVARYMPADYRIVLAHQCKAGGRRFLHLSMRSGEGKLVSLILTRRQADETFGSSPFASAREFQLAGFETDNYLAYVISDLSVEQNRQLAQALSGPVTAFFNAAG